MSTSPRIWVLLGHRRGDNNQLLALAEALGVPFETRTLSYRRIARLIMRLWPRSIAHLAPASRKTIGPPWPNLVIGIGRRSVSIGLWIKDQNRGKTTNVRLGNPRAPNHLFDLVLTTPQYPVGDADNVITLPLALNRFSEPPSPRPAERDLLDRPRPHVLMSLGGTAPMWQLDLDVLKEATGKLLSRATSEGGTLFVAPSPRTPPAALDIVNAATSGASNVAVFDSDVRYPVFLADADLHFVTADSISMVSEAILTGKPVGLIDVRPKRRGRLLLGSDPDRHRFRDPRRFWSHVKRLGLAGTVDEPLSGTVPDPAAIAVDALRDRFAGLFDGPWRSNWRFET